MHMNSIQILDTTLRDGSYAVNFSFTSADTSLICKDLENAGIEYIEIGHGVGLNASNCEQGPAFQTDEEYLDAARSVLTKAKYGMFCIPKIAELKDIDKAAEYGMGFIRIGTNITEVPNSEAYIKRAKDYGMFVTANFMKSYVCPPEKFAEHVVLSENYGSDLVYLVDSSGGMFQNNITEYYNEVRKVSDIPLGFHGHNNLGLAVANTLCAADLGFEFLDASLQGLGRSSGNAPTEQLLAALIKKGYNLNIDVLKIMELGQTYIQPLLNSKGYMLLDVVSGFSDFHSSYMHHIHKVSSKYLIDPALLIMEWCKIDKINMDETRLEEIAQKIKQDTEKEIYLGKHRFNNYFGREQDV